MDRRLDGRVVRTRAAGPDDHPELGRVMVESWLSAHRGQIPDDAWRARSEEWTPEVSARGWAELLAELARASVPRDVLLVAEDDSGAVVGLVHGLVRNAEHGRSIGEISSLYVAPDRHREGVGTALLQSAAEALGDLGAVGLRLSVLTANLPARAFYEAVGGREVGGGTTAEGSHQVPTTIYEWSDVSVLTGG